jgi:hypothetical protein
VTATRIACGWCGAPTPDVGACTSCGRDPRLPWIQRALEPPEIPDEKAGRPALDRDAIRVEYDRAVSELTGLGQPVTVSRIAERLGRSDRTIREWRARFDLR